MIDDITIQKVTDAANVVDVIGDFYSLRNDGVNKTCLCPFHQDKHIGSFKISEAKNIFTCYSCGAHGGPVEFLMRHERLTYPDAIRWLGKKYGIEVEGADKFKPTPCKPHEPAPPLPMLVLPYAYVERTLDLSSDTLAQWIHSLPWNNDQRDRIPKMLNNYKVGHSKQGMSIFWQIDEKGQVRTGKMMLYKADGHRDKEAQYGKDWIHSAMIRAKQLDPMAVEAVTCYFGQHLLDVCPDATINLVESEKTALICAIAYGGLKKHLWIATGGLNFLNKQKLQPFIDRGRTIVLYPDKDGIDQWKEKAAQIGYEHLHVNTDIIRQFWTEADGPKADIADIICRLITPTGQQAVLNQMIADNPVIGELIETFNLEIIEEK